MFCSLHLYRREPCLSRWPGCAQMFYTFQCIAMVCWKTSGDTNTMYKELNWTENILKVESANSIVSSSIVASNIVVSSIVVSRRWMRLNTRSLPSRPHLCLTPILVRRNTRIKHIIILEKGQIECPHHRTQWTNSISYDQDFNIFWINVNSLPSLYPYLHTLIINNSWFFWGGVGRGGVLRIVIITLSNSDSQN